MMNPMISTPYHRRLPETASWLFLLLYGVWAIFVLLISVLIALGFVWLLQEQEDYPNISGLILMFFVFAAMASYGGYALYRAWRLAKNGQNLPKIKQEMAMMPIPTRQLPQNSFSWQTFWARPQAQIWQEKIEHILNNKYLIMFTIFLFLLLLIYDLINIYQIFIFSLAMSPLYQNMGNQAMRLHYHHLQDILILEQRDSEKIWQSKQFDLRNQVGVCTVWQPEKQVYCIQLIDKQFHAHHLISSLRPLETLTQKIAQATGLPILQETPLKQR